MTPISYVLDTNVVSALRRPTKNPQVAAWAAQIPITRLYITAPTIAELGLGVAAKERSDPIQGAILRRWLETSVLPGFTDRILSFDVAAALILSTYRVPEHAPYDDALIASIAQSRGMTVATDNTRHFQHYGAEFLNPFDIP